MDKIPQSLLLCSVCLLLAGCKSESSAGRNDSTQQAIAQEAAGTARLTESQALHVADECAKANKASIDLGNYPDREPKYNQTTRSWSVLYHREPNRWPGDHFMVIANDLTSQAKLLPGS